VLEPSKLLSRRQAGLVLLACLVLLSIQSTLLIGTRWVEDESWLSAESWALVNEGRLRMPAFPFDKFYEVDVAEPVHHLSVAGAFAAMGPGVVPARLVSALSGVATVAIVFALAMDLAGPLCAAVAALFVATDTFMVVAARTARPEAETTLICWAAVLALYRSLRRGSPLLAGLAGVLASLSIQCHPIGLPFVGCLGLYLLWTYKVDSWKQPAVWMFIAGGVVAAIPYLMWCYSDPAHIASFQYSYFGKGGSAPPLSVRLAGEVDRWSDFIGLGSTRVALPVRFPVRLHIVLILLAAFVVTLRTRMKIAGAMSALFLANVLWWAYMANKGPRYMAIVVPVFAILVGCFVDAIRVNYRRLAFAAAGLVIVTQLAANAYWLYKYRTADYPAVTRQLREIIPAGASVYAITTFWMALYDHPYYAYDRTPLDPAVERLKPQYMILYDRVMMRGSGHGEDNMAELRAQATAFVRKRGTLAGRVSNPFYGDLEIYRISY
jgi:4-amino-4-deoxy-L-arabinose transferase-like glycosyltransferase